jgi:hypothetical protein
LPADVFPTPEDDEDDERAKKAASILGQIALPADREEIRSLLRRADFGLLPATRYSNKA